MPVETVPGTSLTYHLVAFDAAGREREDGGGRQSARVLDELRGGPFTDVFVLSHGWQGDVPAARAQYARWIGAMAACRADIDRMERERPGFRPLVVGLHWPSQPWGDESLEKQVSFSPATGAVEPLVAAYAERISTTPTAKAALRTILEAGPAGTDPLPAEVLAAYENLDKETGLGSGGAGAAPGQDRERFDPQAALSATRRTPAVFGMLGSDTLLSPLRALSFYRMKDRARAFGESGAHDLLNALLAAAGGRDVRFHLMGHSFGCIVVSAALCGPRGAGKPERPVDSLVLAQGALSLWAYCQDIPKAKGIPGYFCAVADGRVRGPVLTTRSIRDTAVCRWYQLAAWPAGQVAFAPGMLPKYGGVGAYGAQGPGIDIEDVEMLEADAEYQFKPGRVYNLECSRVIREGGGWSGAHSDIARPEVAHAAWEAANVAE